MHGGNDPGDRAIDVSECLGRLKAARLVAVIRAGTPDDAQEAAWLLFEGGIRAFEITMTVPNAFEAIGTLRAELDASALVGAGTVLSADAVRGCIEAGAQFVVAPNTDARVISACQEQGILCIPGALTPGEIVAAHRLGAPLVKVFPCEAMGGPAYIKALRAPLPDIDLMPTGGVDLSNIERFFEAGACCVGVGGNLVDLKLAREEPRMLVELARKWVGRTCG